MRLVLLGDPVAHSLSPAIQSAALAAAGIPGEYAARRVDAAGVRHAIRELRTGGLDGANVTMPHKRMAATLCDRLEPLAGRAGAVNTLVRVGESVLGHNTDIEGVRRVWESTFPSADGPVLVLGAGGAAAAVVLALEDTGVAIAVSARSSASASAMIEETGVDASVVPWGDGVEGAVVVNATPLGMNGEPLPEAVVESAGSLFDLTYGPVQSPAVMAMLAAGKPVAVGIDLLLAQAAASFRLWTGVAPDTEAMRAAAAGTAHQIRSAGGDTT